MNLDNAINKTVIEPLPLTDKTRFYHKVRKPIDLDKTLNPQEVSLFCDVENEYPGITIKDFVLYLSLRKQERLAFNKKEIDKTELKPLAKALGLSVDELKKDKSELEALIYNFRNCNKVLNRKGK